MNETPETRINEAHDGSDWTAEDEIDYPTAGPGAAFVSNMSIRLMLFLWLVGLVPAGVLATAVGGDPAESAPGELPVGGFIVVGYGLVWTIFWIYFIVSRRLRVGNVTAVQVAPAGIQAVDHLGIWVAMRWEDVTSIGWVRLPSAGAGLAKAVKPLPQRDDPSGRLSSGDGLIGWAKLTEPSRLPRRARKLLASHPASATGLHQVGISFVTAGRVDETNALVNHARRYRPDLFTDRTVREAR